MTLLEKYAKRIQVSEALYAKEHDGASLPSNKKLAVATLLENTQAFLNEAFNNSVGTQRADLGMWKKFCMNLTNVVVPNLIASDLVITYPMPSMSGYITYIKYTLGSNKGASKQGDIINTPFGLGKVDVDYTSAKVVEACDVANSKATVLWTPVAAIRTIEATVSGESMEGVTYTFDAKTGEITFVAGSGASVPSKVKVAYEYDNEIIPQNDIPIVNAELANIALVAKARRVAVYYSNIAAFQAKQDYGFDLGDQLVEKAVGQLQYEIDTEVTDLLIANAPTDVTLTWSRAVPQYISLTQHYESFNLILEKAKQVIYDRTKRFAPNYMLCASDVATILPFLAGWKAAPQGKINGPYFAGSLNGIKVFVTPNIEAGNFVMGVNGDDMMSSAAVYAPYMPIVPTQLLGYADGAMSQGFSTLYALEMLNENLLVKGKVTD